MWTSSNSPPRAIWKLKLLLSVCDLRSLHRPLKLQHFIVSFLRPADFLPNFLKPQALNSCTIVFLDISSRRDHRRRILGFLFFFFKYSDLKYFSRLHAMLEVISGKLWPIFSSFLLLHSKLSFCCFTHSLPHLIYLLGGIFCSDNRFCLLEDCWSASCLAEIII